jgi:cytoskeleton protein RodZ
MIQDQEPQQLESPEITKLGGPGLQLRQAREARQLSLEEVAKNLRLSPQRVALIEADDYAGMGASAFARGYLRSYARFLGVAEEEILASFAALGLASDIQSNKPQLIYERMTQPASHSAFRRFSYLVFLIAVIAAGLWWRNHSTADKSVAEDKAATTISELNQQGVSQVVDPQAANPPVVKEGSQQPLPLETVDGADPAMANKAAAPVNTTVGTQEIIPTKKGSSVRRTN